MKILLLGAYGQLGSDIRAAHARRNRGHDLVPAGRGDIDVSAVDSLATKLGDADFHLLVNCTSYHKTDEVEGNAGLAFAVNAHAVREMARACARKGAKFLHVSTDYVFGGDVARQTPLTEDDRTAPVNVYGASKAMGETLAQLAFDGVTVLRVASLFGVAGASGKGGNFVETMIRLARERGRVTVVNDQTMSPTATVDVAEMIFDLIDAGLPSGIFHAVNSGAATWFSFAETIIRRVGIRAEVLPCTSDEYPARAARPRYSVLDNTKIANAVGPIAFWQDALERYLRAKGHLEVMSV